MGPERSVPQSLPTDGSADLVRRLVAGDHDAWDDAFARFGPAVLSRIRIAIRSSNLFLLRRDDEEDLLLQTFVRVFERHRSLRCQDEAGFLTYLRKVAYTVCIDEFRKRRLEEPLDESTPVDDSDAQKAALIRMAVARLDPELRIVIEMTLAGHTWKEAVAALGIPAKEYWRRKYRAFEILRPRLAELGVADPQESGAFQRLPIEEGSQP